MPFSGFANAPNSEKFKRPSIKDIEGAQSEHEDKASPTPKRENSKFILTNGAVWIPDETVELRLRLLNIVHAGDARHSGTEATWIALPKIYFSTQRAEIIPGHGIKSI